MRARTDKYGDEAGSARGRRAAAPVCLLPSRMAWRCACAVANCALRCFAGLITQPRNRSNAAISVASPLRLRCDKARAARQGSRARHGFFSPAGLLSVSGPSVTLPCRRPAQPGQRRRALPRRRGPGWRLRSGNCPRRPPPPGPQAPPRGRGRWGRGDQVPHAAAADAEPRRGGGGLG